jgi:hypothetical protein
VCAAKGQVVLRNEHINFPALQKLEAVLAGRWAKFNCRGIAKNCCGHSPAKSTSKPLNSFVVVKVAKPRYAALTTIQIAARMTIGRVSPVVMTVVEVAFGPRLYLMKGVRRYRQLSPTRTRLRQSGGLSPE